MTNEEKIENCITKLIETVSENIIYTYENEPVKRSDEIEALAKLIAARATIRSYEPYFPDESSNE